MPRYSKEYVQKYDLLREELFNKHYPEYGARITRAHEAFEHASAAIIEKGYADFRAVYPSVKRCKLVYRLNSRTLHSAYAAYCSTLDKVIIEMRDRWRRHDLEVDGVGYHEVHEAIGAEQYLLFCRAEDDHQANILKLQDRLSLSRWQQMGALFAR